ncbi:MAG TPA: NIPSNAP family protein [Chthoniobacterales bacterium]|nr:NIPSNAP family protein [Chthoniobacterales bacterium]
METDTICCPVVELRQYTLHPGKRDELIDLFEREFVQSQEDVGMRIIGTFRDLDNPDRFVWLRGFTDMASRAAQLAAFYGGPIWKAHREAANVTMIDADNVPLLRPATAQSGFDLAGCTRAALGQTTSTRGLIIATIYQPKGDEQEFADFFIRNVVPDLRPVGVPVLAAFVTEHQANTFPALPVREDAKVFVWFTRALDRADFEQKSRSKFLAELRARLHTDPEVLFLEPTLRSLLSGISIAGK